MQKDDIVKEIDIELSRFCSESLVMIESVISDYLGFAVGCQDVMQVIAESAKLHPYEDLIRNACIDKGGACRFVMPENDREIISLATGILFAMDCRKITVIDFIIKYFRGEDANEAYKDFCTRVILPYRNALGKCVCNNDIDIPADTLEVGTPIPFPEKQMKDVCYWVAEMKNTVLGDNTISETERREFVIMLNGLRYAAELGNTMMLQVVWIGLKHTLGNYKSINRELNNVYATLSGYGVLDTNE